MYCLLYYVYYLEKKVGINFSDNYQLLRVKKYWT